MNEPTDTYVWGAVVDNGIDPQDVLLWNIFPFHPHKKSPFSNRTPSDTELAAGLSYAKALLSLCRPDIRVAAIGRKSAETWKPPAFRQSPCVIRPTAAPLSLEISFHVSLFNIF